MLENLEINDITKNINLNLIKTPCLDTGSQSKITYKKCNKCGNSFPYTNEYWPKHSKTKSGLDSPCKECNRKREAIRRQDPIYRKKQKIALREYYKKHPKNTTISNRLRKFGISESEYNTLLLKQNGVCAICNKPETAKINKNVKSLAVDHCHFTNKIRGLLCSKCNTAIGLVKENKLILENMIKYLS